MTRMSRTGTISGWAGSARIRPVQRQRGVASSGEIGASSHATGQTAIIEWVLGAKRDRLSSRLVSDAHASMAKMSGIM